MKFIRKRSNFHLVLKRCILMRALQACGSYPLLIFSKLNTALKSSKTVKKKKILLNQLEALIEKRKAFESRILLNLWEVFDSKV